MRLGKRVGSVLVFCATTLAAVACTSRASIPADGPSIAEIEDAGESGTTAEFWAAPIVLKLAELGVQPGFEDPEEALRQANEIAAQVEEYVAQCMHDAGFEYIPISQPRHISIPNRRMDREWIAQYGYGVNFKPDLVEVQDFVDPNFDIQSLLSDAELSAYNLSLDGCRGWAWEQVEDIPDPHNNIIPGAVDVFNSNEFAPLRLAISQNLATDIPEVLTATGDWSNCLADAGWPGFTQILDAWFYVEEHRDDFSIAREIELALADNDCRVATDWHNRTNAAIEQSQNQFITDHAADFKALRDAIEQGR